MLYLVDSYLVFNAIHWSTYEYFHFHFHLLISFQSTSLNVLNLKSLLWSQNLQHLIGDLHFFELIFLDLELFDHIEHSPGMRILDIHPLQNLLQHNIPQLVRTLVIVGLEHNLHHKVNEISRDHVRITDEVQGELNELVPDLVVKTAQHLLELII